MRKFYIFVIIISISIFFIACSNEENVDENEEVHVYPFTGIETNEDVDHKAMAVMISNQEKSRPQSGLTKADIVYEMLTEGNITRFMAIYHSELPEVIGPIRSAREYFVDLANDLDLLYIYSGAAKPIVKELQGKEMDHIAADHYEADGEPFLRETFRKAPHNLYMLVDELPSFLEKEKISTETSYEPLSFVSSIDGEDKEEAKHISILYDKKKSIVSYEYDDKTKKYTRYHNDEVTDELESEVPVEIDNVFVIEADHETLEDEDGRRDIDLYEGGKAFLFQRGKVTELECENKDGQIVPVLDGEVVPFVEGKTWVNVVPSLKESKGQLKYKEEK